MERTFVQGKSHVLRIGDFSRLARVSVKTLRFYDEAGLLRPACVDRRSGYRYYRADQVAGLRRIRLFRHVGCTLTEVRELLALPMDSPETLATLERVRQRLSLNVARDVQRLRQLNSLLHPRKETDAPPAVVAEQCLPLVTVLSVRDRIRSLGAAVEAMFETLEERAARFECRAHASPFLLFHDLDYRQRSIDLEACIPIVPEAATACGGHSIAAVARAAVARFPGKYERAPAVYECILEWLDESGARITGPVRECYLRFGAAQRGYRVPNSFLARCEDEYETELQVPFAEDPLAWSAAASLGANSTSPRAPRGPPPPAS